MPLRIPHRQPRVPGDLARPRRPGRRRRDPHQPYRTALAVGDATLTLDSVPAPFAPASTVVTSAILQSVMATAAGALAFRGIDPALLRSGNVDGGHEWNAQVMKEYGDRIFYQQ